MGVFSLITIKKIYQVLIDRLVLIPLDVVMLGIGNECTECLKTQSHL